MGAAVVVAVALVWVMAVAGTVDAAAHPADVWARAGYHRTTWLWQVLGVVVVPVGLLYSGLYFGRVRPRLVVAARGIAVERRPAVLPPRVVDPGAAGVRIRIPAAVNAIMSAPLVILALGAGVGLAQRPVTDRSGPIAVLVVVAVLLLPARLIFATILTPEHLVMRGLLRRRVAWVDVIDITQHSVLGSRYVRVWTRSGRVRWLRAPVSQFGVGGRRFDADFDVLEQWWRSHVAAAD